MINPVDWSTTKAMVNYREEQLNRDIEASTLRTERVRTSSRLNGLLGARKRIGFMLIRLGTRLAGSHAEPRLDLQL